MYKLMKKFIIIFIIIFHLNSTNTWAQSNTNTTPSKINIENIASEVSIDTTTSSYSIFIRAWQGGVIVFSVLLTLVFLSIFTWSILVLKIKYLKKISSESSKFISKFWESRSLNELNIKLKDYPYSPIKEVFKSGYTELIKGNYLKDGTKPDIVMVNTTLESLNRSLQKAKLMERKSMEKYLSFLAISASASPFIGLFGTVWGIMGAFEGIAKTGSASLAAVAPGISEALIATAFGLAAAIPAVVGYNVANAKIREILFQIDGFSSDFLNIIARYLINDKTHKNPVEKEN